MDSEASQGVINEALWEHWAEHGYFQNQNILLWNTVWDLKGVKFQRHYGLSLLLRGISCMAMKSNCLINYRGSKIDPRIPMIYFCDSGGGKGMGKDFYYDIFAKPDERKTEGVGLNIASVSKPTIERLRGSINKEARTKNQRIKDQTKWQDEIIHGIAETSDDMILDESEVMFKKGEYGEEMLRTLRLIADNYGSQNNRIRAGETLLNYTDYAYYCKANFMLLSYHVQGISETIIHNGIFQRCLCFFYHLDEKQLHVIHGKHKFDEERYNKLRIKLINDLKEVDRFITTTSELRITDEAEDLLDEQTKSHISSIFTNEEASEFLQSFPGRMKILKLKMAGCLALLKKKKEITVFEIEEAGCLLSLSYETLKNELIMNGIVKDKRANDYMKLKRALGDKAYTKDELNAKVCVVLGVSRKTAINVLKRYAENLKETPMKNDAGKMRIQLL